MTLKGLDLVLLLQVVATAVKAVVQPDEDGIENAFEQEPTHTHY